MRHITRRRLIATTLPGLAALPLLALGTRRAEAATHMVEIKGFAFSPNTLDVVVGDTITFTNNDGAPHTATALDGAFDTGTIKRKKSAQITVSAAGTHDYKCKFHPAMKAKITAA